MAKNHKKNTPKGNEPEEIMKVSLDIEEGTLECEVVTILEVTGKEYIVLLPITLNGEPTDDEEVFIYGYSENPDDPNEEPELRYIDDDDEYEAVADAFDEFLDNVEFDALNDD